MECNTYHGRVFCAVLQTNPCYHEGMRGAFVPICCRATTYSGAISKIEAELMEVDLKLEGVEEFYDERYFDGVPSQEMAELIARLELYPIQFESVYYFPPNG